MNLLITGAWQEAKKHIKTIEDMGHKVYFLQWEQDSLPCKAELIEGIIASNIFQHHPIEAFTNLRYFQATSAGLDRQPMDYLEAHNITVRNARGVYSIPMAEYAVGGVLTFYKKQRCFLNNQSKHIWEKQRNLCELYGKTVCIVGCGSVGTECAKRFQAFGCHVEGIDLDTRMRKYYDDISDLSGLVHALKRADIIVIAVPLTKETKNLIDKKKIELLKENSIIVNIARGDVMDYEAFVERSSEIKLLGIFDVFPEEPLDDNNPLWDLENVIVTPHNSFQGEGNKERLNKLVIKNLIEFNTKR